MNISDINIEELFHQHYFNLDEETIIEINKNNKSADISNVIAGLKTHCFGVWLIDNIKEVRYQLFYVNGKMKLEGCYIELSIDMKYKSHLIFFFSSFLAHCYDDLDPIDTYNIFQTKTKSLLEKIGYSTSSVTELKENEAPTLFSPIAQGNIKIQFLEKIEIYKELFCQTQPPQILSESDYIYLILNKKNDCIKIGKSKNIDFKRKSLHTAGSDIELITYWQAPPIKERELHNIFSKKRKNDNWFELKFKDLTTIKKHMQEYELKDSSTMISI